MTTNPHDTLNIRETIEEIGSLSRHLERLIIYASEDEIEDVVEAIEQLRAIQGIKATLRDSYADYEQIVAHSMEGVYQVKMPDGQIAERMEAAPRKKWDHKAIGAEVARRIVDQSIDLETGEITLSRTEIAERMLQFAAPSYWRIKELKKLAIDADKYCEAGDPKISVVVRKPKGKK